LVRILFEWAASRGEISRSMASSVSLVWAPASAQNSDVTLRSGRPLRSIAAIVFSKLGGARSAAIASISRSCAASASSNASRNASGAICANGGASNGVVQAARIGLVAGGWVMDPDVMDRRRRRYSRSSL
jgi:hypothetical protein